MRAAAADVARPDRRVEAVLGVVGQARRPRRPTRSGRSTTTGPKVSSAQQAIAEVTPVEDGGLEEERADVGARACRRRARVAPLATASSTCAGDASPAAPRRPGCPCRRPSAAPVDEPHAPAPRRRTAATNSSETRLVDVRAARSRCRAGRRRRSRPRTAPGGRAPQVGVGERPAWRSCRRARGEHADEPRRRGLGDLAAGAVEPVKQT